MSNSKVQFIELTQQEYDESLHHVANGFYHCKDTDSLYFGDTCIVGSSGGGFVPVYFLGSSNTCDKTYSELEAAYESGSLSKAKLDDRYFQGEFVFAGKSQNSQHDSFYFLGTYQSSSIEIIEHNDQNVITRRSLSLS